MRLWTFHPRYLDARGLTALWREALLARAVLRGETRGYRSHPQLERFRTRSNPEGCVDRYLRIVHRESLRRGYRFDGTKLRSAPGRCRIDATEGQVRFEWAHFLAKARLRAPGHFSQIARVELPEANPLFRIVPGPVEPWERGGGAS